MSYVTPTHSCSIANRTASVVAGTRERYNDTYTVTTGVSCFVEPSGNAADWGAMGLDATSDPLIVGFQYGATVTIDEGSYIKVTLGPYLNKVCVVRRVERYSWPRTHTQLVVEATQDPGDIF